jgi:hypothetical protein
MSTDTRAFAPHCDVRIIHAPLQCVYCDKYPEVQQARIDLKINFSGQAFEGLAPCPADAARGFGQAHQWVGNQPRFYEEDPFDEVEKSWFRS